MKAMRGSAWTRVKAWVSSLAAGRAANGLSIAARLDMGSKKSLMVVAYGKRRFLVGGGAETISAILDLGVARPWSGAKTRGSRSLRHRRARARQLGGNSAPARGELRLEMSRGKR